MSMSLIKGPMTMSVLQNGQWVSLTASIQGLMSSMQSASSAVSHFTGLYADDPWLDFCGWLKARRTGPASLPR